MELGVALPTSGAIASPAAIVRIAREAERLGYDALWTYERLLRPVDPVAARPGQEPEPVPVVYRSVFEPLETLSYVAAVTDRIKLGTSIIDALFHAPVVLARRFATLDQFSDGRVIAGLGQGWMPQEFETANVPMRRIGAGMDEVVAAMRACWGPDPVSYQGRFYRIAPSEVNPKPVQAHIPILLGAMSPGGVRRAARIADGINPIAMSAHLLRGFVAGFRVAAEAAGRDPAGLRVVARATVPFTEKDMDADRPYLGGSARQIADDIAALDGVGVDHVLFSVRDATDVERQVDLMAALVAAVRP